MNRMELRGVRVHNLKNIDLDIPLNQLVVVSGVSGSGKSSLAFDTLFVEGQRRYIESFSTTARRHLERIERPDADRVAQIPVAIAIRSDRFRGSRPDPRSTVASFAEILDGLRLLFARLGQVICPGCGRAIKAQTADEVAREITSLSAGTKCQLGFVVDGVSSDNPAAYWLSRGYTRAIWNQTTHDLSTRPRWPDRGEVWVVVDRLVAGKANPERILESATTTLRDGEGRCWLVDELTPAESDNRVDIDGRTWRIRKFSRRLECLVCQRTFLPPSPRLFGNTTAGGCPKCRGTGRSSDESSASKVCPVCMGTRYRAEACVVKIAEHSIVDILKMKPAGLINFLHHLSECRDIAQLPATERIRTNLLQRLETLCELGLDYLDLDRSADSLSGGELRRLLLAAAIGSHITGTLIVIDEPSDGLAETELPRLIKALRRLQRLGNSVVVVDHAARVIDNADQIIELGPGAGPSGGAVQYQGPPRAVAHSKEAVTSVSARQAKQISGPQNFIRLSQIQHPIVPFQDVEFPLGRLSVVSGPSGSGKTSLVVQTLYPAVCRKLGLECSIDPQGACDNSGGDDLVDVVLIDQSPLAKSSRSNPATWLEVFQEIRQTFASTDEAKIRGYTSLHFSFNSAAGGRCRSCQGTGLLKHDMQFLPDVTLPCPECAGTRYRKEILDVKYRGRSIADVLAMSVSDAASFFRSQSRIQSRFQLLKQIGLDYLVLGQPCESLSGGEAQRLKLASRLIAPNRGACLIICDEPTSGLHPTDTEKLVTCFQELIANGNSLVIADNSSVLRNAADCVIVL